MSCTRAIMDSEMFVPSFEHVHALATANLVASTQRDIALQLAEASFSPFENLAELRTDQEQLSTKTEISKVENLDTECVMKKDGAKKKSVCPDYEGVQVKALVCSFKGCGRKFAWNTHLKYHELTHSNNRQFECPHEPCTKTFLTSQNLKVHLRIHSGEKPYKCTYKHCGKSFTTAGNLKNHHRIHTGEQPFVCDFEGCCRRFTENSSLRKHKLTHSGDKPYECCVCNKKFAQSGSRNQHMLRHRLDREITASKRNSQRFSSSSSGYAVNTIQLATNTAAQSPQTTNTRDQSSPFHQLSELPTSHILLQSHQAMYGESFEGNVTELIGLTPTPPSHHLDSNGDRNDERNKTNVFHDDDSSKQSSSYPPIPIISAHQLMRIENLQSTSPTTPPTEHNHHLHHLSSNRFLNSSDSVEIEPNSTVRDPIRRSCCNSSQLMLQSSQEEYGETTTVHKSKSSLSSIEVEVVGEEEITNSFLLMDGEMLHEELIETNMGLSYNDI